MGKSSKKEILNGKASTLLFLRKNDFNVPNFFVISQEHFQQFLEYNCLKNEADNLFKNGILRKRNLELLRSKIVNGKIPKSFKDNVQERIFKLHTKSFAVRSSSSFEDSQANSYAGQFSTILNVSKSKIFQSIKSCWASAFNDAVFSYSKNKHIRYRYESFSLIIQKMVKPKVSGVGFSLDPISHNKKVIYFEFKKGEGDILMSGSVTPEHVTVSKKTLTPIKDPILSKIILYKKNPLLSEKQIKEISKIILDLEKKVKRPCDVEWVYDGKSFHILQCRPITT